MNKGVSSHFQCDKTAAYKVQQTKSAKKHFQSLISYLHRCIYKKGKGEELQKYNPKRRDIAKQCQSLTSCLYSLAWYPSKRIRSKGGRNKKRNQEK